MKNTVGYKNGNYTVSINLRTGTKIRETEDNDFVADFPENIDVKITNCCNMGCPMCHENSVKNGKHGNIMDSSFFETLTPYTELALGGGNVLEHPDLVPFLHKLKELKMIPNITVNQVHFMEKKDLIKELSKNHLIYGLGISLVEVTKEFISAVSEFPHAVIHVINGIVEVEQLKDLRYKHLKVLILGYKEVRRGKILYGDFESRVIIEKNKQSLFENIPIIVRSGWFDVISFDNLAIKQLNPQRFMSQTEWEEVYMGDDGIDGEMTSASMYVDLVENVFARNSCDIDNRFPINNLTAKDMYQFLRGENNEPRNSKLDRQ